MESLRNSMNFAHKAAVVSGNIDYSFYKLINSAKIWAENLPLINPEVLERHAKKASPHIPTTVTDGERVAVYSNSNASFVSSIWGTWLSGRIAVPLATAHPSSELIHVISHSGSSIVAGPSESKSFLEPLAKECGAQFIEMPNLDSFPNSMTLPKKLNSEHSNLENLIINGCSQDPMSGCLILYTSGSTGKPKGALLTHFGINEQARMLCSEWEYSSSDRVLNSLPLHHIHGLVNGTIAPLSAGATVELSPRFNPDSFWRRLRDTRKDPITVFTGVPTMYYRLIQSFHAMSKKDQHESAIAAKNLRLMMCGSSGLPAVTLRQWEEITGHRLLERYGMTELGMVLTNPIHGQRVPGSVGSPFNGIQVKVSEEEGADSCESRMGELCVKSNGMFREYWKDPKATARQFDENGFFKTGDIVEESAGKFKILGRKDVDIIKHGGFKLSSLEIENILLQHPEIEECAVLGISDEIYGESVAMIASFVNKEVPLTLREIQAWARDKLAHYKIPTSLMALDCIPRNTMGKVVKKELKKLLLNKKIDDNNS